jgi:hypothetical protein
VAVAVVLEPLAPTATLGQTLLALEVTVSHPQSQVQPRLVLAVVVAELRLAPRLTAAQVVAVTALLGQAVSVVLAQRTRVAVVAVLTVRVVLAVRVL